MWNICEMPFNFVGVYQSWIRSVGSSPAQQPPTPPPLGYCDCKNRWRGPNVEIWMAAPELLPVCRVPQFWHWQMINKLSRLHVGIWMFVCVADSAKPSTKISVERLIFVDSCQGHTFYFKIILFHLKVRPPNYKLKSVLCIVQSTRFYSNQWFYGQVAQF